MQELEVVPANSDPRCERYGLIGGDPHVGFEVAIGVFEGLHAERRVEIEGGVQSALMQPARNPRGSGKLPGSGIGLVQLFGRCQSMSMTSTSRNRRP